MDRNYDAITLCQNKFNLWRLAIFPDIIKIVTMFIFKKSLKTQKRKNQKLCIKMQSTSVFLDIANLLTSGEKMLMSAELKGCVAWFICVLDLLYVRYNFVEFHYCRICVSDLGWRRGGVCFPLHHPWATPKRAILNNIKKSKKQ